MLRGARWQADPVALGFPGFALHAARGYALRGREVALPGYRRKLSLLSSLLSSTRPISLDSFWSSR